MVAPLSVQPSLRHGFHGYNPMAGVGIGGGSGIIDMVLQILGQSFIGSKGLLPLGVTHQNLYDRMKDMKLEELRKNLAAQAAESDAKTITDAWLKMQQLSGTPVTKKMYQEFYGHAKAGAQTLIPMFAQFPGMGETVDSLMGYRGSSTVMSEYMFRGGRFRMDPMTGEMGLGADSMKRLNRDVFRRMFAGDAYLQQNLSAGRTGMLFEELQQLGLMPSGQVSLRDLAYRGVARDQRALSSAVRRVTGRRVRAGTLKRRLEELTPDQVTQVSADKGVAGAVAKFDSRRVTDTLTKYSGAVKAMQEIFGDAGRPNAPMPQLINALNQLTGGSLSQLDSGKVEMFVRKTYNLAKTSGLNVEGMLLMSQMASTQAQSMGLDPSSTPGVLQSMLQSRVAMQQLGFGGGGFGQLNIQEMTQHRGFLSAAAAQSRAANQMSTTMRVLDMLGPDAFKPGSEAASYIKSIRDKNHQFTDAQGNLKSVAMDTPEWIRMLTRDANPDVKLSRAFLIQSLQARGANLEYQQRFGTAQIAEAAQPDEFWNTLAAKNPAVRNRVAERMRDLGLNARDRQRLAPVITRASIDAMRTLRPEDMTPERRSAIVSASIRRSLQAAAQRGDRAAAALLRRPKMLKSFAEKAWEGADFYSRRAKLHGYGNLPLQSRIKSFHKALMDARRQAMAGADVGAIHQQVLAPLDRGGGMLRNAMQAVLGAKENDDLGSIFAKALGGRPPGAYIKALTAGAKGGVLGELRRKAKTWSDLTAKFRKADTKTQQGMLKQIGKARNEYKAAVERLVKMAKKHGQLADRPAMKKAPDLAGVAKAQQKLSKVSGVGAALGIGMATAVSGKPKPAGDPQAAAGQAQTIIIQVARLELSPDASAKIIGKGKLPVAAGRQ